MLRRFLKDGVVYGLSTVLSRGIGLLLLPLYTRMLSPAEYGMVDLLQLMRSLVALTVTLEIGQGLVRFFVDTRDEAHRRALASTALWFTAAAYGVYTVVALAWASPLSRWLLDTPGQEAAFRLAVAYVATGGIYMLLQDLLRFELRPRAYAAASLLNLGAVTALTVPLLLFTPLRVEAIFLGLIGGNLAGGLYSWAAARQRYALVFDWARCREMLAFGAPLVASGAAVFVANFVDRIAIRSMMTVADVGVFGVAARFASAAALIVGVLQTALSPLVYSRHAEPGTPGEIARILRMVALVLVPAIVVLGLFAPEAIAILTTPAYLDAAGVIPLLAASVLLSQFWVFAPGLGLAKRTRHIAGLNIVAAIANTLLNYALIPLLGIRGAALSTLLGAALTATGYQLLGQRHYPVPHAWGRLLGACGVGVAALWAAGALWGAAPAASTGVWAAKGALAVLVTAAAAVLLVRRDEVGQLAGMLGRRRGGGTAAGPDAAPAAGTGGSGP